MPKIGTIIKDMHELEALALKDTFVHRLHPLPKIIGMMAIIIGAASFGRYSFFSLVPYIFYPFVLMALAEIPYRALLPRLLIALPFVMFAGLSNAWLERSTAFIIYNVPVSYGALSLFTLLLKMYLCVMAALILVSTTTVMDLSEELCRLHLPQPFVLVFDLTYRYIQVLIEEANSMTIAYSLRGGGKKALEMRHMGSFAGQLLLRGFDRAERVYYAMQCRGYGRKLSEKRKKPLKGPDYAFIFAAVAFSIAVRLWPIG